MLARTLGKGLQSLKADFENEKNYYLEFLQSVKDDVIAPLKKFKEIQAEEGKQIFNEISRLEDKYFKSSSAVESVSK